MQAEPSSGMQLAVLRTAPQACFRSPTKVLELSDSRSRSSVERERRSSEGCVITSAASAFADSEAEHAPHPRQAARLRGLADRLDDKRAGAVRPRVHLQHLHGHSSDFRISGLAIARPRTHIRHLRSNVTGNVTLSRPYAKSALNADARLVSAHKHIQRLPSECLGQSLYLTSSTYVMNCLESGCKPMPAPSHPSHE